jgi:type 1 glutamine amidotransferase
MMTRYLMCLLCAAAVAAFVCPAAAQDKIPVLLLDGQNNHKWQETTPVLKEALLATGRFTVDVLTSPAAKAPKEEWDKFKPDFTKYKAVLSNYTGTPWPEEVCKSFEKYMQDGGGLVMYHAAVFAFPQWEAWNKMIGMGWRDAKFGDRIYIDEAGKEVRQPKGEGPGSGHGPAHVFELTTRDAEHPVMKGLPAKWSHVKDELYHGMRGPAQDIHILATAFSNKDGKGTGMNEPIIWTVPVGKGRVLVNLLGHDAAALDTGAKASICRGVEWAATGAVTLPAPKDMSASAPPAKTESK